MSDIVKAEPIPGLTYRGRVLFMGHKNFEVGDTAVKKDAVHFWKLIEGLQNFYQKNSGPIQRPGLYVPGVPR